MLELSEAAAPVPFEASSVDERSEAELDALPFGVIALDEEGTVLRYNLYESRFARLDRNQVLGRNFFTEIAPCTRTEAFEGRFHALVAAPEPDAAVQFDFVFDFTFGAQDVSVELLHAGNTRRFYLLINRRRVAAPRPEVPREQLAALQVELAPAEELQGVLRDDLERRFVDTPAPFFSALRATCDRLAPDAWQLFSTEWGVQWGRRVAVDLEASVLESTGRSMRDVPMRDVALRLVTFLGERGWGSLDFDFTHTEHGLLLASMERSILAESAPVRRSSGASKATARDELACHLLAGWLSGILSSLAGRRLAAREVSCAASGAARCSFVVVGHSRRDVLQALVREAPMPLEALIERLRRAPRHTESPK